MKFSGYYKNAQTLIAEQTKKSGSTTWDYNQLSLTHKLYSESEGAEFPYYDCWLVLRDQPKWNVDFTSSLKSDRRSKLFSSPKAWSCSGSSQTPDDHRRPTHESQTEIPSPENTPLTSSRKSSSSFKFGNYAEVGGVPSLFSSQYIEDELGQSKQSSSFGTQSSSSGPKSSSFEPRSSSIVTQSSAVGSVTSQDFMQFCQLMIKQHQEQTQPSSRTLHPACTRFAEPPCSSPVWLPQLHS